MKQRCIAVLLIVILILSVGLVASANSTNASYAEGVAPEPIVHCNNTRISPTQIKLVCTSAGVVLINQVINLPKVSPIEIPVTMPTVEVTDIVRIPGPTKTVEIPGPTTTTTISEPPQTATMEVTRPPRTVTATETVTRQAAPDRDRIGLDEPDSTKDKLIRVGFGLAATLAIGGFSIMLLWFGFVRGWISARKNEERKMRNLLSFAKQGKHR